MTEINKTLILCLDDEIEITRALDLFLSRHYEVLTANHPNQALEIVKEHPDLKVILSDYVMPEMNGCEFFEEVRKINDEVHRIIISGYANDIDIQNHLEDETIHKIFSKPWKARSLLEYLNEV